ncbi:unnamed protein product, partial [marine sediment metagenome]
GLNSPFGDSVSTQKGLAFLRVGQNRSGRYES